MSRAKELIQENGYRFLHSMALYAESRGWRFERQTIREAELTTTRIRRSTTDADVK